MGITLIIRGTAIYKSVDEIQKSYDEAAAMGDKKSMERLERITVETHGNGGVTVWDVKNGYQPRT